MQKASRMLTPCGGTQPLFRIKPSSSLTICPLKARHAVLIPPSTISSRYRTYATESSPSAALEPTRHPPSDELAWPSTNPNNPYEIPTPYEIFKVRRGDPYSKRRFYELVKIYHPDRQQLAAGTHEPLPANAKLERYRMIIAANELLSDPRRRRLYDQRGIGWDGRPEFGPSRPRWKYTEEKNAKGKDGWSGFNDNVNDDPRANATWEDWEAWQMRQERTHGEQRPVYMNNGAFVVLVCLAAGVAATAEGSRAGQESRSLLDQLELRHDRNSKDLMRRRDETQGWQGSRDERTREFLRLRGTVPGELELAPVGQELEGSKFVAEDESKR